MKTIFTLTFLAITSSAIGQHTLTQSSLPVPGESMSLVSMDVTGVTEGATGANVTWNFQNLVSGATTINYYSTPGSSPYGSAFPNSTVVLHDYNFYSFYSTNGDFRSQGFAISWGDLQYSDEQVIYPVPFTYGSSHSDSYAGAGQSSGSTYNRTGSLTTTCDAWGTLILPSGNYSNVIRVKTVANDTDVFTMGGSQSYSSESYNFYGPGQKAPLLYITSMTTPSGTAKYVQTSTDIVGTEESSLISLNLYPNPAVNSFSVESEITTFDITITDMNGALVRQFEQVSPSTKLNIESLSSGIYFVTINSEGTSKIVKLVKH